ncbi:MAG: hypothetical protein LW721_02680 [Flammeovirgaceae bacterium]|jgi:hypothetical protein|nr:hypothetical protein [Flammeovirgaceae bacterium]
MARILLFLLVVLMGASCFYEPDCLVTASSAVKIEFKQTKTNPTTRVRTVVDSALVFNSVLVSGIDTAYIKYKLGQSFSSVTLPVDPRVKTIKYVFNIRSTSGVITRKDSIVFNYASESVVIAPRCGAYTYFLDLKISKTNYDSTKYKLVSNRLLKGTTNVQVFF